MRLCSARRSIVENRPSAGGIVALEALRTSLPDGYTLSFVHVGNMSVAPSLFQHLPYDTTKDFAPVGIFWRGVQLLVVNPAVQPTSLAELVKLAKASPGRLRYSSPGNGTPTHLGMEQWKHAEGIDIQHIPYKGPASLQAVLSGEVDMLLEGVEPLLSTCVPDDWCPSPLAARSVWRSFLTFRPSVSLDNKGSARSGPASSHRSERLLRSSRVSTAT